MTDTDFNIWYNPQTGRLYFESPEGKIFRLKITKKLDKFPSGCILLVGEEKS